MPRVRVQIRGRCFRHGDETRTLTDHTEIEFKAKALRAAKEAYSDFVVGREWSTLTGYAKDYETTLNDINEEAHRGS